MAKPITDSGNELDANFSVEDLPTDFNIVIESRGGSDHDTHASGNGEYSDGLRLMLERLGQHHSSLEDVQVASNLAEQKPESERQIFSEDYSFPIQLDRLPDKEACVWPSVARLVRSESSLALRLAHILNDCVCA